MIYYYYPLENTLRRYATHHAKPLVVKTISVTVSHGSQITHVSSKQGSSSILFRICYEILINVFIGGKIIL